MKFYSKPAELRAAIRTGEFTGPTPGQCPGFVQANLAILPSAFANDFERFASLNPKACPILEKGEPGNFSIRRLAPDADIRTDLPLYRVFKYGELVCECTDILAEWTDDLIYFLIGCSFSFEDALKSAGIQMKYGADGKSGPVYLTNIDCTPAGPFCCKLAVSMRPIKRRLITEAVRITGTFPHVHGEPIHIGTPEQIGISNLNKPDFGSSLTVAEDEEPVFWACGVTPQLAIRAARPPIAVTHAAGHMLVADVFNSQLEAELFS